MKRIITAAAVLILAGGAVALAQPGTGGGAGNAGGADPSAQPAPAQRLVGSAPVGHRQPRADSAGSENGIAKVSPEDAELDRKIKGICRGC